MRYLGDADDISGVKLCQSKDSNLDRVCVDADDKDLSA